MKRLSYLAVALSLGSFACSSSSDKSTPSKPLGDGGVEGAVAPSTFKLHWSLMDITAVPAPDGGAGDAGADAAAPAAPPVVGATVCINGHTEIPCVTTGADGAFDLLGLAPLTNYVMTINKDGFYKEAKIIQTASTDMDVTGGIAMFETSKTTLPAGVTQDPAKGLLSFFAIGPQPGSSDPNAFKTEPGVAVSMSPTEPSSAGPYFSNGKGQFLPGATATADGYGWYYNLAPGDYTITYTDSQYDCQGITFGLDGWGIPVPPTSVQFTVLPGYLTDEVGVFCTAKSVIVNTGDGG